eukprot:6451359-Karenia_brevis.AAC.1
MDNVDRQAWEMRYCDREYVDFEWTMARVANPVVGCPDVSTNYWLDNLTKVTRGGSDVPIAMPRQRPMLETPNDDQERARLPQ